MTQPVQTGNRQAACSRLPDDTPSSLQGIGLCRNAMGCRNTQPTASESTPQSSSSPASNSPSFSVTITSLLASVLSSAQLGFCDTVGYKEAEPGHTTLTAAFFFSSSFSCRRPPRRDDRLPGQQPLLRPPASQSSAGQPPRWVVTLSS
ncbi:hypothetical protein RRF57_010259 [Xylaria bambusicola]|uniref:Uncharacterized protein n=1 Tax=Xylaria bambusicola TaxID=326684 RepID=A0AAN7UWY9_9PEZI